MKLRDEQNRYRLLPNKHETVCSRCAAVVPPGGGVVVLIKSAWKPFCDEHDPRKIEAASEPPAVTVCPPMAAFVLGESSPGWRRDAERKYEWSFERRAHATHNYKSLNKTAAAYQRRLRERLLPTPGECAKKP